MGGRRRGLGRIGSPQLSRRVVRSRLDLGTVQGGWQWRVGTSYLGGQTSSWRRYAKAPRMCRSPTASAARRTHPAPDPPCCSPSPSVSSPFSALRLASTLGCCCSHKKKSLLFLRDKTRISCCHFFSPFFSLNNC